MIVGGAARNRTRFDGRRRARDAGPVSAAGPATKPGFDWWAREGPLLLAALGFHSFIAKPFYIPSELMLPGMRVGDRLVVNKFAYGWSLSC
ncbi:S26 family signal peptidase [Sphingomonas sp. MMS24-JH45]